MSSRREPILWIQLLAVGFIPLECLFLRLILAGAQPGPFPEFQRIIFTGISIILPTIYFFQRPPDWGSLLILKIPIEHRSKLQLQLSTVQKHIIPRIALWGGAVLLTIVFWQIDKSALVINEISPFQSNSRIVILLKAMPLLSLILWQWHQICQSIWLLAISEEELNKIEFLTPTEILQSRCCVGFGFLPVKQIDFSASITSSSIKNSKQAKHQKKQLFESQDPQKGRYLH